jgi:hypothetical protein
MCQCYQNPNCEVHLRRLDALQVAQVQARSIGELNLSQSRIAPPQSHVRRDTPEDVGK